MSIDLNLVGREKSISRTVSPSEHFTQFLLFSGSLTYATDRLTCYPGTTACCNSTGRSTFTGQYTCAHQLIRANAWRILKSTDRVERKPWKIPILFQIRIRQHQQHTQVDGTYSDSVASDCDDVGRLSFDVLSYYHRWWILALNWLALRTQR